MKNVAVLGATTLIGEELIKILEQKNFPTKKLFLFASEETEKKTVMFKDDEVEMLPAYEDFIDNVDLVFSCVDDDQAKEIIPKFKDKAVVIDTSHAFRMETDVPLVIPEINPEEAKEHNGIIANPSSTTIHTLVPLYPLHQKATIKRMIVATYQSVSGHSRDALDELKLELEYLVMNQNIEKSEGQIFEHPIANNIIPQIGNFNKNGYTNEETHLLDETRKILKDDSMQITSTCVRVPVFIVDSEVISVEFENSISPQEAKGILKKAPGVKLFDKDDKYPMPVYVAEKDVVFVGRVRKDNTLDNGLALWIVANNLRKGAALNAVQIAELL